MNNISNYAPKNLDDFVYFDEYTECLIRAIVSGDYPLPEQGTTGLLLYGPAGTGKTSLAKSLPDFIEEARGGESGYFEFFACGEGDDDGAKLIKGLRNVLTKNPMSCSKLHFIVLDEIDNLTKKTLKALKGIMNTKHALFILTTNNVSTLDAAIKDRCLPLPFLEAPAEKWLPLARRMLADKNITGIDDGALLAMCRKSGGSARALHRHIYTAIVRAQSYANSGINPAATS